MKPLIGITCNYDNKEKYYITEYYANIIDKCGGIPILLPPIGEENIKYHVESISGLILSGGVDIDPVYFECEPIPACGEITPQRDFYEISLIKEYFKTKKPLLAICRGMQILNVACGGTIYQDIYTEIEAPLIKHSQDAPKWYPTHTVYLQSDSILFKIFGLDSFRVNSFHHQAIRKVAEDFKIVARSSDKIIEAIEHKSYPFVVGVQWHPECMVEKDELQFFLFKDFVKKAQQFNKKETAT